MKRTSVAIGFVLLVAGAASAQMGGDRPMRRVSMAGSEMGEILGPELMAACRGDLDQLGLSPEGQKAVEDKHFELKKKVIRGMADLRVQKLELGKLLERKDFDLSAARKKVEEIAAKEAELRNLHLDFLADLRSSLADEQWQKLRKAGEGKDMIMKGGDRGMKQCMGDRMPMKGDSMPCMQGAGMQVPKPEDKDSPPKPAGGEHEMMHGK